jgi:chromosome segregation ATPase
MKKSIVLGLLLILNFACADLKKEQLIEKIHGLNGRLDNLEVKLKDSRIDEVASIKNNTMQTELRIKQNLHLDTVNMELAQKLDAYKLMRRSIKPLMQQYVKISQGIKEEKHVLKELKNDIKNGRGERNRYKEYIEFERQKVGQLTALLTDFMRAKNKFFADYKRLYPPVAAFADSLLEKNVNR